MSDIDTDCYKPHFQKKFCLLLSFKKRKKGDTERDVYKLL